MKNNKFTDGKIGDKGGEMKKQAKGNETPQRASRQVLGDLGVVILRGRSLRQPRRS